MRVCCGNKKKQVTPSMPPSAVVLWLLQKPLSQERICACWLIVFQVSGVAGALPVLVEKVSDMEGRLGRALAIARRGLDILADQLVALGALNGRGSPNKNPLAGKNLLMCYYCFRRIKPVFQLQNLLRDASCSSVGPAVDSSCKTQLTGCLS